VEISPIFKFLLRLTPRGWGRNPFRLGCNGSTWKPRRSIAQAGSRVVLMGRDCRINDASARLAALILKWLGNGHEPRFILGLTPLRRRYKFLLR
jgi:23S rRNA C2498 (ribose-2'-O)-methylase RlmM